MDIRIYQKMYAILCGAASDAVDLLTSPKGVLQAKILLETALLTTEEIYLNANESTSE